MTRTEMTVGLGVTDADVVVDLGAHHPSAHGALRLALTFAEDRIVQAEPIVGHLHRGAEKLFEARDYRQILMLANRHDWLSAFCSELGVCLAVERMLGLPVPPRAVWLRTLLAELTRISTHLAFLRSLPAEIAGVPAESADGVLTFRAREAVQLLLEEISGGRMHVMFNRIGGLHSDAPAGWTDRVRRTVDALAGALDRIGHVVADDETFAARTRGVGALSAEDAAAHGVSGPMARASGLDLDLRRDDPYLAYDELVDVLRVVTGRHGDALDRFRALPAEIAVSLDLISACLDRLPGGEVDVRLPKVLRVPEGEIYLATENPAGINGYYLVSRNERTPWRLKLRSASFANVSALGVMLPGARIADLVPILGSMFFTIGDIDR